MSTCTRCHKAEAREGLKSCAGCGAKAARNMQRVRALGGKTHRAKQRAWSRASFERRKPALLAAGICLHCQCKPAAPGRSNCPQCIATSSKKK